MTVIEGHSVLCPLRLFTALSAGPKASLWLLSCSLFSQVVPPMWLQHTSVRKENESASRPHVQNLNPDPSTHCIVLLAFVFTQGLCLSLDQGQMSTVCLHGPSHLVQLSPFLPSTVIDYPACGPISTGPLVLAFLLSQTFNSALKTTLELLVSSTLHGAPHLPVPSVYITLCWRKSPSSNAFIQLLPVP